MMTVTQLAKACGLSRTAVLYYESIGLLPKPLRSVSNYRKYDDSHAKRLRQICSYRESGLKLADIQALLSQPEGRAAAGILEKRLACIGSEIARLREHQTSILRLLRHRNSLSKRGTVTKGKWVNIMQAAGFNDEDMHRWHCEFEKAAPDDHQEFLEYLKIPAGEVARIRTWSQR